MGLTSHSTGVYAMDSGLSIKREENETVIGLAGNPNVGKSTVFNALTGMNQHTGNWPGKTVTSAQGRCARNSRTYILVDLPGTYSLLAHSAEEEVARDFICFGGADTILVVCDATCLERNLNLVLQAMEITGKVMVCVNLMDEARRKKIQIDLYRLESLLGVPVVGMSARSGKGLEQMMGRLAQLTAEPRFFPPLKIEYPAEVEEALALVEPEVKKQAGEKASSRWLGLKLLDEDPALSSSVAERAGLDISPGTPLGRLLIQARETLRSRNVRLGDAVVSSIVKKAENISREAVRFEGRDYNQRDRRLDKILTSKKTGIPIMLALLMVVFWLTITGANYPSELISSGLFWVQDQLTSLFSRLGTPSWVHGLLVLGIYRVVAWIVSVMLPPMAIFFPLFTLLEDFGYLPRVAFNLDRYFKKACACGKQALSMCMGFGCNAAGVIGCRIIGSPRERLIAVITNNFVPCNGRFPMLIAIISMFFVSGTFFGAFSSLISALLLTLIILLGILMTFLTSRILSKTVLKGIPSSFTLELPPYRRPQIGKVILRSIFDRTLFVLGRAVTVAAPAGLVIWLLANIEANGASLLAACSQFLDPFARLLGMDGVILLAFILGFPANEIVLPIVIMAYLSAGSLGELDSLTQLHQLLADHGWTWLTASCTMLFSLMHWPCSTTCLTIYRETKSVKWTLLSAAVPTAAGIFCCFLLATAARLAGMA